MSKVIRESDGTLFVLAHQEIRIILGERIKDTWWLECDEKGNVSDGNNDGVLKNMTIHCKIPKGKEDIDISTLSENCLK